VREGACIGAATIDTKSLDIEVDPQRCRCGSRKSDIALQDDDDDDVFYLFF
jgi:hypothetical protein